MKKKLRQVRGKIRRYVLVRFRPGYVHQQVGRRQGECNQCGNCCEILFKCPFLVREKDGAAICSIYDDRPGQCAAFPIDEGCLSDVDFDCTFDFADPLIGIEEPVEAKSFDPPAEPELLLPAERLKQRALPALVFSYLLGRLR